MAGTADAQRREVLAMMTTTSAMADERQRRGRDPGRAAGRRMRRQARRGARAHLRPAAAAGGLSGPGSTAR